MGKLPSTTIIAAVLVFMFFVFITSKGQLPAYLAVLGIAPAKYLPQTPATKG